MRYLATFLFAFSAGRSIGLRDLFVGIVVLFVGLNLVGREFATVVLKPAPDYMHDEYVMPAPLPVQQTYVRRTPCPIAPSTVGFDAVFAEVEACEKARDASAR